MTNSRPGLAAWRSTPGALAVIVIAGAFLWRAVLLLDGFFTQDDFLVMTRADRLGIGSELLGAPFAGQLSPLGNLFTWFEVRLAPMNWTLTAWVSLTLQVVSAVVCWQVISRLLGDRWARLPLLVIFCLTPLTLWTTQQWTLSWLYLSATLAALTSIWALLRQVQDDWRFGTPVALAALAIGIGFDTRLVLFPIVWLGVCCCLSEVEGRRSRMRRVLSRRRPLWIGSALIVAGYAVLFWRASAVSLTAPPSGDAAGEAIGTFLRQLGPGLVGGPWVAQQPLSLVETTPYWTGALAAIVALLGLGLLIQGGGRRVWWGLAPLVLLIAATAVLLLFTSGGTTVGIIGAVPRSAAAVVPGFVVLLAAVWPMAGSPVEGRVLTFGRARFALDPVLAVVLCVALLGSTAYTYWQVYPELRNSDDRAYVDNVRQGLADDQVVLLDGPTPEGVMSGLFGVEARVSTVVGLVPEQPVFDLPSQKLRAVGYDGVPAPVRLTDTVSMQPSDDPKCGYPVTESTRTIALTSAVGPGDHILRIGYYTSGTALAYVDVLGHRTVVPINQGLNAVDVVVHLGGFDSVQIGLTQPGATVCVADLTVGVAEPLSP